MHGRRFMKWHIERVYCGWLTFTLSSQYLQYQWPVNNVQRAAGSYPAAPHLLVRPSISYCNSKKGSILTPGGHMTPLQLPLITCPVCICVSRITVYQQWCCLHQLLLLLFYHTPPHQCKFALESFSLNVIFCLWGTGSWYCMCQTINKKSDSKLNHNQHTVFLLWKLPKTDMYRVNILVNTRSSWLQQNLKKWRKGQLEELMKLTLW